MRARTRASTYLIACALACCGAGACSDAIDVLEHADLPSDAAIATDADTPQRDDASVPIHTPDAGIPQRPDAGKPPTHVDTGEPQGQTCGAQCGAQQLCALDDCVDAADVHTVALSRGHACEVAHGQLFCWGDNRNAQLGVGDTDWRNRRARVGTWNDWLSAAVGEDHSCAIRSPGRLYCWGLNTAGQLGVGDTNARDIPAAVGDGDRWQALACGGANCCALQEGGALYCWGDNLEGKIGQADPVRSSDVTRPTRVAADKTWRAMAVGQGHVCAITLDGALYCWGRNSDLELGIGSADPVQLRAPTRIGDAGDWRAIAASQHHTCGVRNDGSLWCWGTNAFFELGAPPEIMSAASPLHVGQDSDWDSVSVGWFHTCGQKRDGRLFCFGRAIEGQLGQGQHDQPLQMPGAIGMPERWQHVALGNFYTCGIDEAGALYCWGAEANGALGLGDDQRRYVPALVP